MLCYPIYFVRRSTRKQRDRIGNLNRSGKTKCANKEESLPTQLKIGDKESELLISISSNTPCVNSILAFIVGEQ